MFRCNHHPQGVHYLNLLKLRLFKQSIKKNIGDYFNNCNFSKLK